VKPESGWTPEKLLEFSDRSGKAAYSGSTEDVLAAAKTGPIGALLSPRSSRLHMVVIEQVPAGFLVRDPFPGVTYTVDQQWIDTWVAGAFWK
jgi:hypothetical protein